jgi:hypothetical protein
MSEKTVHKTTTPHGKRTPHKYPDTVGSDLDILNDLSIQLYPTGRAWYRPENGVWENFHGAINRSFSRLIKDGRSLIDSTFPDNPNFNSDDATLWEFRLGLITNENINLKTRKKTLEIRKKAIKRKLGHPNNIEARQHPLFIQSQLQAAGFDVWVHENTIPYQNPESILDLELPELQHGEPTQHGDSTQHGGGSFDVIANSIEEVESFAIGEENLWATFFLGGEILGTLAEIPYNRLKEFKETVIKLKPAHTVAFTFISYT